MKSFLLSLAAFAVLLFASQANAQRVVVRGGGFRPRANVFVNAPGVSVQAFGGGFRRSNVFVGSGFAPNAVFVPQFVGSPVVIQSQPSVFVAPTAIYGGGFGVQSFGVQSFGVRTFGGCGF